MISVIKDIDAYKHFLFSLPELEGDEVYMLILAARNKYLTPEQKQEFKLGNSCVLNRQIIKDKIKENSKVLHYIFDDNLYTDVHGRALPENCYALYITVNPRSVFKATQSFNTLYDKYIQEYISTYDKATVFKKFSGMYQSFNSEIQNKRGTVSVSDIDFDVVDKVKGLHYVTDFLSFLAKSRNSLDDNKVTIVETRGGYHLVIHLTTLTNDVKRGYYNKLQELHARGQAEFGEKFEIFQNKQDMIPVPGSMQGGFIVRVVDEQTLLTY